MRDQPFLLSSHSAFAGSLRSGPARAHAQIKTRPGRFVSFGVVANASPNPEADNQKQLFCGFCGGLCGRNTLLIAQPSRGGLPGKERRRHLRDQPFSSPATPLSRAAPPGPAGAHARIKTRPGRFVSFRNVANASRNASDHKATDARRVLVLFAGSSCPPL